MFQLVIFIHKYKSLHTFNSTGKIIIYQPDIPSSKTIIAD